MTPGERAKYLGHWSSEYLALKDKFRECEELKQQLEESRKLVAHNKAVADEYRQMFEDAWGGRVAGKPDGRCPKSRSTNFDHRWTEPKDGLQRCHDCYTIKRVEEFTVNPLSPGCKCAGSFNRNGVCTRCGFPVR